MSDPDNSDGNPVTSPPEDESFPTSSSDEPVPDSTALPPDTSTDVLPQVTDPPVTDPPVPNTTSQLDPTTSSAESWSSSTSEPFHTIITGSSTTYTFTDDPNAPATVTLPGGMVTTIPVSQKADYPHICNVTDAKPIVIQNATSWNETGCLKGFICMSSFDYFYTQLTSSF